VLDVANIHNHSIKALSIRPRIRCGILKQERQMVYKVSDMARADDGPGFNITVGQYNQPLVHFCYENEQDAINAAKEVRVAITRAKLVKPQA
jgi:hypothetical protein